MSEAERARCRAYYAANREKVREQQREYYESLPGLEYNRRLLRTRRNKANARRRNRQNQEV